MNEGNYMAITIISILVFLFSIKDDFLSKIVLPYLIASFLICLYLNNSGENGIFYFMILQVNYFISFYLITKKHDHIKIKKSFYLYTYLLTIPCSLCFGFLINEDIVFGNYIKEYYFIMLPLSLLFLHSIVLLCIIRTAQKLNNGEELSE